MRVNLKSKFKVEFERINGQVAVAEKKLNTFDKVVGEWRLKCEDLSAELDNSQRECRNQSSELFRLRAAWDEAVEQLDSVRRYHNLECCLIHFVTQNVSRFIVDNAIIYNVAYLITRENKNLADEIKDLMDQLGEGGRSIHELDKQRRRLQVYYILLIMFGLTRFQSNTF